MRVLTDQYARAAADCDLAADGQPPAAFDAKRERFAYVTVPAEIEDGAWRELDSCSLSQADARAAQDNDLAVKTCAQVQRLKDGDLQGRAYVHPTLHLLSVCLYTHLNRGAANQWIRRLAG